MLRQDYIGRLIQQLAEALARIANLSRKTDTQQIEAELASVEAALGFFPGMDRLDARSTALLLGGGDKVILAVQLLEQRALLASDNSEPERARVLRRRAVALLDHAKPDELTEDAAQLRVRLTA